MDTEKMMVETEKMLRGNEIIRNILFQRFMKLDKNKDLSIAQLEGLTNLGHAMGVLALAHHSLTNILKEDREIKDKIIDQHPKWGI